MDYLLQYIHSNLFESIVKGSLWAVLGFPAVFILAKYVGRITARKVSAHAGLVVRKLIAYCGFILVCVTILLDFNFNLSAILGTAGIASVAVGFAAQKSLSNLISGLFLIWERPFQVGDLIRIDKANNITGYILSIDLLSVKMRTKDNLFVRIPNETLVQSDFVNISRFPTRRYSLNFGVAYNTDLKHLQRVLLETAKANTYCLPEPEPEVLFVSMGDSAITYNLNVWTKQEHYNDVQNTLSAEVIERFRAEKIEIPYPRRDIVISNQSAL